MRLRVSLEADGGSLRAPVHYNHLLQGLIYNNLDRALSKWLHEKGHTYGQRRFKLFTFSPALRRACDRLDLTRCGGSSENLMK